MGKHQENENGVMPDTKSATEPRARATPAPSIPSPRPGRPAVPLLALAILVPAAGCTVLSGPESETVRGILAVGPSPTAAAGAVSPDHEPPDDPPQGSLEVPDTVGVGEAFTAMVRTVGMNGCWAAAGEDVSVDGLTATIVPFDATGEREGVACTTALVSLRHDVRLTFREAGEAAVRVEGRRILEREGNDSEPMSLEATVTVVP